MKMVSPANTAMKTMNAAPAPTSIFIGRTFSSRRKRGSSSLSPAARAMIAMATVGPTTVTKTRSIPIAMSAVTVSTPTDARTWAALGLSSSRPIGP